MIIHAFSNSAHVSFPQAAAESLDGFRAWVYSDDFPDEGKYTYFQTEVLLDMAAEWANSHAEVKTEITSVLKSIVRERDLGKLYGDGMWFTNDDADVSNEPDAMFVSWETLQSGRLTLIKTASCDDGIEYQGSPDWALEVVSDSSEIKDKKWLTQAYHAAGIREYWLVDARGESIEFTLNVWSPSGYLRQVPDSDDWLRSEIFDCDVRLHRKRDRVCGWEYKLHTR